MKTILLILTFNIGIEILRVYDPEYYTVKEVKIKKIENVNQLHRSKAHDRQQ